MTEPSTHGTAPSTDPWAGGALIGIGAGIGLTVGLLLGGGAGIPLGVTLGAAAGVVVTALRRAGHSAERRGPTDTSGGA